MSLLRILAAGLIVVSPAFAKDRQFVPDTTHTVIGFTASTLLFEVTGSFDTYQVRIKGDPDAPGSAEIRLEIDTKSVNTFNKNRDEHLRSADFLDVAKYPKMTFTSSKVTRQANQIIVQGTLDLHGKTQPMTLTFEEAKGLNGAGKPGWAYRAKMLINRQKFGVGADSVAAKISLKDGVQLNLLLVGSFE